MAQNLKEKLVGAAVLLTLMVIFLPLILQRPPEQEPMMESNIPVFTEQFDIIPIPPEEPRKDRAVLATADTAEQKTVAMADDKMEQARQRDNTTPPQPETQKADKKQTGFRAWVVQLGSFKVHKNAEALSKKIRNAGHPSFIEQIEQGEHLIYRVRVGPELSRSDAEKLLKELESTLALDGGVVILYP